MVKLGKKGDYFLHYWLPPHKKTIKIFKWAEFVLFVYSPGGNCELVRFIVQRVLRHLYTYYMHLTYIRTESSLHVLSAFLTWFKLVNGPCGHTPFLPWPDRKKNEMYQIRVHIKILALNQTGHMSFRTGHLNLPDRSCRTGLNLDLCF